VPSHLHLEPKRTWLHWYVCQCCYRYVVHLEIMRVCFI